MLKNYSLTPENVDIISDVVNQHMVSLRMPQRGVIRGRLTVESVLLNWLSSAPEGTEISLKFGKQFLRPYVRLYFEGIKVNPLENEDEEEGEYYKQIMANAGLVVDYRYRNGYNVVDIKLPMVGMGSGQMVFISAVASLATAAWISSFGPEFVNLVSKEMITPLFNSVVNLLGGIAAFMVFFNVANGILRMGDVDNLNTSGTKVLNFVIGRNVLAVMLSSLIGAFCFNVVDSKTDFGYDAIRNVFVTMAGIVPNNLVQPFIDANTTQIIFLAIVSGILLLVLGRRLKVVYDFISELEVFFSSGTVYFCNLIPLMIYLALINVLLEGNFGKIFLVTKILLVLAVSGIIFVVIDTLWAARKYKDGMFAYLKLVAPVVMKGLSTGNAPACGELWDKTCAKFKFERKAYGFSSIACQILSAPGFLMTFVITVMGIQESLGIRVTLSEVFFSAFVYVLLTPSPTGIPGGSISVMAILMAQNHFPEYCIAVYIAMNFFFDMLITGVNNASSVNNMLGASNILQNEKTSKN